MAVDNLLLNVFQSVAESAPVVVEDARARESPVPVIESPFGVPETKPSLLLKVFQSEELRYPFVVLLAWFMPKTPVRLLYVSGPVVERALRFILLLKVFQSVAESAPVVVAFARRRERV